MTGERLSDSEALIWRIESDPVLRTPILVIGLLDRTPSWERLRTAFAGAATAVPRLRHRLVPFGPGGRPRWVEDPSFDLDHHLRRVRAPHAGGLRPVLDLAEPDVMSTFDPARPLWQCTLVEGLEGGRAAFVLRFHHTISDGVGAVGLAQRVFTPTRDGAPLGVVAPGGLDGAGSTRGRPNPVTGTIGLLRFGPVGLARTGLRTARSVARILAPATSPLSPIMLGRGIDRSLHTIEVPLQGLQHAARAVDGTVNDVFLAAVAGGMHAYHEAIGVPVGALRVTMPISIRRTDDAPGGNRFAPVRFVLPVDDPDPAHRAVIAASIVRRWRAEPAVGLTSALAALLDRLPAPLVRRAFAGMLRSVDVDVVDVPGLRGRNHLAGALVERMWAFAPPTGAALSVTLLSHADVACIGISSDRAAVEDAELLASCIEHGFDDVLALAGESAVAGVPS